MTHEPDIPERDPALDAAWRQHSIEVPSAAMDAAILAAAHRAVGSAPEAATKAAAEATSPQRWWMPLAAAATRKVPVSMRSGITRWLAPCSSRTPSITMRSLPAPAIRAPIAFRQSARSTTSGSRAAFSITVSPSARVAAIIRFSVPVTVTRSVTMRVPFRRLACATR